MKVTAAQIPLNSLEEDIGVTRRLLAMQTEPTVLVGHSYGGAVITGAAVGAQIMATRMGATIRSVAASHAPFISRPQEVADIIAPAMDLPWTKTPKFSVDEDVTEVLVVDAMPAAIRHC